MRQKIIVIMLLIFLAGFSCALTLKSEKTTYEKGTDLELSGNCDSSTLHKIKAEVKGKKIFEEQVNCFGGKFDFKYTTGFLDPSGNWNIKLFTSENETEIIAIVKAIPESAYYRITFLSPAGVSFRRGETILVSVEVTDSGEAVDEAEVIMFDVFGRRISLKPEGRGAYDINYAIPFNSKEDTWDLTITAQKETGTGTFGGERNLEIDIMGAAFNFNVIEPSNQSYEQSDPLPIKVQVTYSNGVKLRQGNIEIAELRVGQDNEAMEINSDGDLILSYLPKQTGNQVYRIYIKDNAGNESEKRIELTITCSITCFMKSYGLIILVIILVVGVVAKLFYAKIQYSVQLITLQNEKEKTMELIKNLQKEYFGKAVMPASSYKSNLASYKAKLIELEEKIKRLKHNIEQEK